MRVVHDLYELGRAKLGLGSVSANDSMYLGGRTWLAYMQADTQLTASLKCRHADQKLVAFLSLHLLFNLPLQSHLTSLM